MRTLLGLPTIVKDLSPQFPFGTIQNETDTQDGTPVIREIYGDVLTNIYKLLKVVGITATGTEDSDISQYQIIEALKKLPNSLNDIEQVLDKTGLAWHVPFDLELLPNKYVFFARASESYVNGSSYTFRGLGLAEYTFNSPTGFNASDELLIVIDSSEVRAYSLSFLSETSNDILTPFGSPIAYNDSNLLSYFENGNLLNDTPNTESIEQTIRVFESDGTLLVTDVFIVTGFCLCVVYYPSTVTYKVFQFDVSDYTIPELVTFSGGSIGAGTDYSPYFFTNGSVLFVTNGANANVNNYDVAKFTYNSATPSLTYVSSVNLDVAFEKTTNTVIKSGNLYTFKDNSLKYFNVNTGVMTVLDTYNGIVGQIFLFNSSVYFTSGEVGKKWTI
jgi:hypothetical protein